MKKISILYENMQSCKPDDYYNDIIAQPPSRKVRLGKRSHSGASPGCVIFGFLMILPHLQTVSNRESEIQTEDEQSFLARQQQLLQQGQSPARGESPLRSQPNNGTKSTQRTPVAAGAQGSPKKVRMPGW